MLRNLSHVKKARINSADVLADVLDKVYKRLKEQLQTQSDLDADIQVWKQNHINIEVTTLRDIITKSDRGYPTI